MATQRSFLKFYSYFSAEAVSIATISEQGPNPRKLTMIFGSESSKLLMKTLSRVFFLKQGESTESQNLTCHPSELFLRA